jgi:hypothetical protein
MPRLHLLPALGWPKDWSQRKAEKLVRKWAHWTTKSQALQCLDIICHGCTHQEWLIHLGEISSGENLSNIFIVPIGQYEVGLINNKGFQWREVESLYECEIDPSTARARRTFDWSSPRAREGVEMTMSGLSARSVLDTEALSKLYKLQRLSHRCRCVEEPVAELTTITSFSQ